MDFSQRLKELRKENKLTQQELADLVGLSKTAIVQYENGKRKPNYEILKKLANFFNVSTDYLIGKSCFKEGDIEYAYKNLTIEYLKRIESLPEEYREKIMFISNILFINILDYYFKNDIDFFIVYLDFFFKLFDKISSIMGLNLFVGYDENLDFNVNEFEKINYFKYEDEKNFKFNVFKKLLFDYFQTKNELNALLDEFFVKVFEEEYNSAIELLKYEDK